MRGGGKPRYYGAIPNKPAALAKLVKTLTAKGTTVSSCYEDARVAGLEQEMVKVLTHWAWAPVVEALMALRSVKLITAMTVIAELGDLSRFASPR